MKIFCITGNGTGTAAGNPYWHMLPDSTLLRSDNPFFVPEFDSKFQAYPAIAIRIDRLGKSIAPRFAHRYYNEATVAVTVRAENLLRELRDAGLPWDRAVAFDRSCLIGDFQPAERVLNAEKATLCIGEENLDFNIRQLKSGINDIIAKVSENNTLKTGDLILLYASDRGLTIYQGKNLTASTDSLKLLEIRIR